MSMTKQQFFDELAETLAPTEAEFEAQYYWEMSRRRQRYIDHITEQIMAMPESHWFSHDFEAWMNEETSKMAAELFIRQRNASKTIEESDYENWMLNEDESHAQRNSNFDNLFF